MMEYVPLYNLEWWISQIPTNLKSLTFQDDYHPWFCSIIGALLIGIVGILPLVFISKRNPKESDDEISKLQLTLSFAVGSLLGDVFLHLLPEAWNAAIESGSSPHQAFSDVGLSVLSGIFLFILVEMLAAQEYSVPASQISVIENNNIKSNGEIVQKDKIKVIGYLNLIANGFDNFTHGLAVAGSFLVSFKTGILTTSAILMHEIPHEIGDFAILLNSGFSRWEAAKAQIYTASIGLVGALVTLAIGSSQFMGHIQTCVLGFTAGGFLNIALVNVLPGLMKETRPSHSAAQIVCLLLGVAVMSFVATVGE